MLTRFCFFVFLLSLSGCSSPEVQRLKQRILGTNSGNSSFSKVKTGMTLEDSIKTLNESPTDKLTIEDGRNLHKFADGFIIEKNNIVEQAIVYPEIKAEDTVSTLVTLGDSTVDLFRKAGWPLKIINEGTAHVLFYRTGTLLLKEYELINTFNRNVDYQVSVSAYKGTLIAQPKYFIIPSVSGIDRNSLEFIEVKKYVEHLLLNTKAETTENPKEANVILFVNFGVGDKNTDILTYSRPIYHSVYTQGHTSTTQVQNQFGQNIGSIQTSTPGTYSSQYGGQSTTQYKIDTYRRHLMLEAVHASGLKLNGERKYFWKIVTESYGPTGDFRAILPVLSFGAAGYVFKNSGKSVDIRIDFDQMMNYFLKVYAH